jgi:hypothetical protein
MVKEAMPTEAKEEAETVPVTIASTHPLTAEGLRTTMRDARSTPKE